MEREKETLNALFQHEFAKMVAVISSLFGLEHIEIAEDIVSETFLLALEDWKVKGVPPNPIAWLYTAAKRKTLRHLQRDKTLRNKIVPELVRQEGRNLMSGEPDFSDQNIKDSQLQMLFAICNPAVAGEAQIGLALRILCGFRIEEVAEAFLSNKETINKRLTRAKEKLRAENIKMELPPANEIEARLDNVLHVIYLLFNEGYYSKTQNKVLRKELCLDAIRLAFMLTGYDKTNRPKTSALLALMCFHASRFGARQTLDNEYVLFELQDTELWDQSLITSGFQYLSFCAQGAEITSYHLEARIAALHCIKEETREKWEDILHLYNQLLQINYSPAVALNRTFALYKAQGHDAALPEAERLNLDGNHFYHILLGELYKNSDRKKALFNLKKAHDLARTQTEKQILQLKIYNLQ